MAKNESDRIKHLYITGVKPTGKKIGVGAYGRVFEVEFCGTVHAAKEIHSILVEGVRPDEFKRMKEMFIAECLQSSALGHRNVVRVLGVYNPGGGSLLPVLVMERMQESLTSLVEKYPNIPMYVKLCILLDVSRGLWYLHSHDPPIIHRDLSPNNVLLDSWFVAKISDLGVAKVIRADSKKTKTRAPGTVDFMPPEALLETPEYGPPLDVFSYGGVILHVVNQEWPTPLHYVVTDPKTRRRVALSEVERREEHVGKIADGHPAGLQLLVKECLDDDPRGRPVISDVSERINGLKEVESVRHPDVKMDPTTWQQPVEQTSEMLQKTSITPSAAEQHEIELNSVKLNWEEVAPLPVGRSAHTAVLLQGSVYVGGGYEGSTVEQDQHSDSYTIDFYNLLANQWSSTPITTPYCSFGMTVLNDKLLIVGGGTKSDEVVNRIFVLVGGQWKFYNEMPTARSDLTAIGYQSKLIVVGGHIKVEGKWIRLSVTELLDTISGCWYTCNDLPSPHIQLKGAIVNNVMYLLGGTNKKTDASPQVFAASLTDYPLKWRSLPDSLLCLSAVVVLNNKHLLTLGGRKPSDRASQSCEVCSFDSSSGVWKQLLNVSIPEARSFPVAVSLADNKIIVLGGGTKQGHYSKEVWIGVFE